MRFLVFMKLVYRENETWRLHWEYVTPSISREEKELLQQPFQKEEIHGVIKSCERDEALCLDGFSRGFYKKCWPNLKADLLNAFKSLSQL